MAVKHLQQKAFKRSSCDSGGGVEFSARKLIYFVLLQLVLSSFVLITADTLNGSQNNNNNNAALAQASSFKLPKLTPLQHSSSRFGCATNRISDRTECTGGGEGGTDDGVLKTERTFNETDGKTTKENLILWHGDGGANDDEDANATTTEHPFRDDDNNLSLTENASIRNQSRQTITSNGMRARHRRQPSTDGGFHKDDGERVLSRKRRYLIFPPGSSIQIGKLYLHFLLVSFSFPSQFDETHEIMIGLFLLFNMNFFLLFRTVYDTYHPIVDHSNLLIIGITAAMAWELPSKPVDLNEYIHGAHEMEELRRKDKNVTNASPQYVSKSDSDAINQIDSNGYYTNIPKRKIYYEKSNQYQSPYKSYGKYKNKAPLAAGNKLQNYVMYADSLMKQFKRLTDTIPTNRKPFSPANFQEFANV